MNGSFWAVFVTSVDCNKFYFFEYYFISSYYLTTQYYAFQEKIRQYEEERDKYRKEKSDWRQRNHDDVETARQDLIRMTNKVTALQDEIRAKDGINHQLR